MGIKDVISPFVTNNYLSHFLNDSQVLSYDYIQKITLANLTFNNFSDVDYNDGEYSLGIKVSPGESVFNYSIEFAKYPTFSEIINNDIILLGKKYTIINYNSSINEMTLKDKENTIVILNSGSNINYSGEIINGLKVYLFNNSDKITQIKIEWKADNKLFAAEKSNITFSPFNNLNLQLLGTYNDSDYIYGNFTLNAYSEYEECSESWNCSSWSICSNGIKTRACSDSNNCGTTNDMPDNSSSCSLTNNNCTNECSTNGSKICFNSTSYKLCGNYDSDSCLEYGTPLKCPNESGIGMCDNSSNQCVSIIQMCSSGNNSCVTNPQLNNNTNNSVNINSSKECTQIGSQNNGSYCSTEYKLIQIKQEGISCKENYECSSNKCENNKCLILKVNQTRNIIYIFIVGIIIVLIILVSLLILNKLRS